MVLAHSTFGVCLGKTFRISSRFLSIPSTFNCIIRVITKLCAAMCTKSLPLGYRTFSGPRNSNFFFLDALQRVATILRRLRRLRSGTCIHHLLWGGGWYLISRQLHRSLAPRCRSIGPGSGRLWSLLNLFGRGRCSTGYSSLERRWRDRGHTKCHTRGCRKMGRGALAHRIYERRIVVDFQEKNYCRPLEITDSISLSAKGFILPFSRMGSITRSRHDLFRSLHSWLLQ